MYEVKVKPPAFNRSISSAVTGKGMNNRSSIEVTGRPVTFDRLIIGWVPVVDRSSCPTHYLSHSWLHLGESIFYDCGFALYGVKLWTSNWFLKWHGFLSFQCDLPWIHVRRAWHRAGEGDNTRHHSKVITALTQRLRVTSIMQPYMEGVLPIISSYSMVI